MNNHDFNEAQHAAHRIAPPGSYLLDEYFPAVIRSYDADGTITVYVPDNSESDHPVALVSGVPPASLWPLDGVEPTVKLAASLIAAVVKSGEFEVEPEGIKRLVWGDFQQ